MTGRYEATLAGVKMSSLHNDLLILDISCPPPTFTHKKRTIAALDGYEISDTYLEKQEVTITFELHIYKIADRDAACQKINKWAAAGGALQINSRSGQYLSVICTKYASIESAKKWTDPLTVTFTTTSIPYWQSTAVSQKTIGPSKTPSGKLSCNGNTSSALVSVTVTAEAKITNIDISVGDSKISLTGLNVPKGKTIAISYLNGGRTLRILANGNSALGNMKASSADNLQIACGTEQKISCAANAKVTAKFSARGKFL